MHMYACKPNCCIHTHTPPISQGANDEATRTPDQPGQHLGAIDLVQRARRNDACRGLCLQGRLGLQRQMVSMKVCTKSGIPLHTPLTNPLGMPRPRNVTSPCPTTAPNRTGASRGAYTVASRLYSSAHEAASSMIRSSSAGTSRWVMSASLHCNKLRGGTLHCSQQHDEGFLCRGRHSRHITA